MKKKEILKLLSFGATIKKEEIGYFPEKYILNYGLENHYLSKVSFNAIKDNLALVNRTTRTINRIGGRLTECKDEVYRLNPLGGLLK